MSLTRPRVTSVPSPVKHYFSWTGKTGMIQFYDKLKKEDVEFSKMKFIVLDELHTVGGFQNKVGGIRGSKVRQMDEPISVWVGKGKKATYTDTWANLKGKVNGIKYAKALYVAVIKKDSLELAELLLSGAAFSAWMNFTKGEEAYEGGGKVDVYSTGIEIPGRSKQLKNGDTKYYEPVFQTFEWTEEELFQAKELDKVLQEYFDGKAASSGTSSEQEEDDQQYDEVESEIEELEEVTADGMDDLPF